jgi:uncharacterized protein YecT (DUF1311 family)
MKTEEFAPDLSALQSDYQILTELRRSENSRTYLARHLKLNRDVTITVVRAADAGAGSGDNNTLTHFASDARTLTVMRHRNVVPVIEGRWLGDGIFAIVRARVRGSTLEQTVATAGALPQARVASTLEQVYSAIEWARANGIVHRHVAADAIVFQQGSGRVLLELDPSPLGATGTPDECDDARTIGRLAYEMLAGSAVGDSPAKPLAQLRPDLPARVVRETEALMQCDRARSPRDGVALISLLGGKAESAIATPPRTREPILRDVPVAVPVSGTIRTTAPARDKVPAAVPVGASDGSVVVVKRPFGYNARVLTAVAVAAIIAVLGVFLLNRSGPDERRTAGRTTDTTYQAAGEVALTTPRADTFTTSAPVTSAPMTSVTPAPVTPVVPPTSQTPVVTPQPLPSTMVPNTTSPSMSMQSPPSETQRMTPPVSRRPEPPRPEPSRVPVPTTTPTVPAQLPPPAVVRDPSSAIVPIPVPPRDTTPAKPADVCDSPDSGDQHKCLMNAIEQNDRDLNSVYNRLIIAMRRQAGVPAGDPDPESVSDLRSAQRAWLDTRDSACRSVGDGSLYARARSQCFAEQSSRRVRELQERLNGIPDGAR